jgi:Sjoegren syndrome nuclear autoantigen 1
MSSQGAALQNYNNELVKCTFVLIFLLLFLVKYLNLGIEDLCGKRDELQRQILIEEEDKHKLENEIRLSSEKLARINENLAKKITARTEFDRTISETESAYMKILESSQTLLSVILTYFILIQFLLFVFSRYSNENLIHFVQKLMIKSKFSSIQLNIIKVILSFSFFFLVRHIYL